MGSHFIFLTFLLIILFWPFLWADPIKNLLLAFSQLSSAAYPVTSFYLEKFTLSTTIPWHYHIVWISVTTPLVVISLFLVGFLFLMRRIFHSCHLLIYLKNLYLVILDYNFQLRS